MIDYSWSFPSLEYAPSVDGLSQVVKTVHWRITATDGNCSSAAYGTVGLSEPEPELFVDYEELTPALVQAWAETSLGEDRVQQIKDNLSIQIAEQKQPKIISSAPPWV